jgi:hypothetical protein
MLAASPGVSIDFPDVRRSARFFANRSLEAPFYEANIDDFSPSKAHL